MINGIMSLLIAIWLITIVWNGREGRMIATISAQSGFLKWLAALITLAYIYNNVDGKTGEVVQSIAFLAVAAFLLKNGKTLFSQIDTVYTGGNENGK